MEYRKLADAYRERLVAFAQRLIQTPSPSGEEGAVARLVAEEMKALRYDDVWVDAAGNVIGAFRGQGGKSVMLNGHLDHVDPGDLAEWPYPPFSGKLASGAVWGRGTSDNKGALATQIYGVAACRDAGLRFGGDVYVTAVVMEEVGGVGTRALLQNLRTDFAVVGESTSNQIARGHRGRVEVVLTVKGRPGHASAPALAVNPHDVYARFLTKLQGLVMVADPIFGVSTVAPTLYETDQKSTNVIPGEARLHLDWRNIPSETVLDILRKLQSVVDASLIPGSAASLALHELTLRTYTGHEMTIADIFPPFALPLDHELVVAAEKAVEKALDHPVRIIEWKFATDGGHLMAAGIPTIGFGPGEERLAHTTEDRIDVEMMLDGLAGYVAILHQISQHAPL